MYVCVSLCYCMSYVPSSNCLHTYVHVSPSLLLPLCTHTHIHTHILYMEKVGEGTVIDKGEEEERGRKMKGGEHLEAMSPKQPLQGMTLVCIQSNL